MRSPRGISHKVYYLQISPPFHPQRWPDILMFRPQHNSSEVGNMYYSSPWANTKFFIYFHQEKTTNQYSKTSFFTVDKRNMEMSGVERGKQRRLKSVIPLPPPPSTCNFTQNKQRAIPSPIQRIMLTFLKSQ